MSLHSRMASCKPNAHSFEQDSVRSALLYPPLRRNETAGQKENDTSFPDGAHAHRTPLSYSALAPLFSDEITHTQRPDQADIYVFAHSLDIENAPLELVEDWRQRQRPIVLLSEEPFWDTIWGRQPPGSTPHNRQPLRFTSSLPAQPLHFIHLPVHKDPVLSADQSSFRQRLCSAPQAQLRIIGTGLAKRLCQPTYPPLFYV